MAQRTQGSPTPPESLRGDVNVETLAREVLAHDRRALAKAITLVESTRDDHRDAAQHLLELVLPSTGKAVRIGITGVPGVGKSTFIEAFGRYLIGIGKRVAVLAVDPSSARSGGSILGDKTRMSLLSAAPEAFIRPSPSGGSLGGVARRTREAMLVCEAAGYDVVIVETVGVGQLEDAALDALELVARAGQEEDEEEVDHRRDRELRLPDADRLDDDDVVARRLADEHRLARAARDAAERAARRARPDERLGSGREPRHPRLVAEDAAARERARRVDG